MALKIVFMGTPVFAVPVLDAILGAGHHVVAVYSQPPRRSGRGLNEQPSPVHRAADAKGLTVLTPLNFKGDADRALFAAHNADVAVVVAYGLILPETVLAAPRLGCFNVHASKLPRWRGAAPIQRAIMAGDKATAVMVMRMERGLDTGPICLESEVGIEENTTAGQLSDVLSQLGAGLMVEALSALEGKRLNCTPQDSVGITYAAKIDKAETRIDFGRNGHQVADHIRGLSPAPGAWFEFDQDGRRERVKVLSAIAVEGAGKPGSVIDDQLTIACGAGAVRLLQLQRAGKKLANTAEFLRGFKISTGDSLA